MQQEGDPINKIMSLCFTVRWLTTRGSTKQDTTYSPDIVFWVSVDYVSVFVYLNI